MIRANDKRRARLNAIRVLLHGSDYEGKKEKAIGEIDPKIVLNAETYLRDVRGE